MKQTKNPSDFEIYTKVFALGTVAGLRAMLAPAFLSYAASRHEKGVSHNNFFASRGVSTVLGLLTVGELIGDKLPSTPNRTEPLGLGARIVSGAVCGGSVCSTGKKSVPLGIALGALTAVAAAYAGQNIRRAAAEQADVHSSIVGAVEDMIAIRIGAAALRT